MNVRKLCHQLNSCIFLFAETRLVEAEQDFIYNVNIIDLVIEKKFDDQIIFFVLIEGVTGKRQKFGALI